MLGLVNRTLHGAGSVGGAPGTGFTGFRPFPQTNPLVEEAGNTGPARVQFRLLPAIVTAVDPIPFVGFSGA